MVVDCCHTFQSLNYIAIYYRGSKIVSEEENRKKNCVKLEQEEDNCKKNCVILEQKEENCKKNYVRLEKENWVRLVQEEENCKKNCVGLEQEKENWVRLEQEEKKCKENCVRQEHKEGSCKEVGALRCAADENILYFPNVISLEKPNTHMLVIYFLTFHRLIN